MQRPLLFVVNPRAGSGRAERIWKAVEGRLRASQTAYEAVFTTPEADGYDTTLRVLRTGRYRAVVAVGGDGTANEVVNALLRTAPSLPFGVIPAGSGNDLAHGIGFPSWEAALEAVLQGTVRRVDVGRLGERYFLNAAGVGIDGVVADAANRLKGSGRWPTSLSKFVYVLLLLAKWVRFRPRSARIVVDDRVYLFHRVWLVVASNHPFFAGGMRICPGASSEDGLVDVCVVHRIGRLPFLFIFPLVYTGLHTRTPYVTVLRGRSARVRFRQVSFPVQADGEILGEEPLRLTVEPGRLWIFVPRGREELRISEEIPEPMAMLP